MRAPHPDELEVIHAHEARVAALRATWPAAPCYGYLRTDRSAVLIGAHTQVSPALRILDWRRAPLASVYLGCGEGEPFQLAIDEGRELAGTVLERTHLVVEEGALTEIARPDRRFVREPGGWRVEDGAETALLVPRPPEERGRSAAIVLDPRQQEIVDAPVDQPLLVLGEAGFGKTTVALHRIARQVRAGMSPARVLVLVPTPGLVRLCRLLLERLDVRGVHVSTVGAWLLAEARATLRGLPQRDSTEASVATLRLKRHPALRAELLRRAKKGERTRRADLLHLFGDSAIVARVVEAASLAAHTVEETVEHTRVQFSETTERAHAHVDADRLATVDGARIDEGTPMSDADSLDAEDAAVLLELHHLRGGASRARWDHVVLDEAQELSPLELAVIGRARAPGGALTVAGDEAQQTDDTAYFPGWSEAMRALGAEHHRRAVLTESYRCPPEVEAYARALVGRTRGDEAALNGEAVVEWRARSGCERVRRLADALSRLEAEDPTATIGVVCRTTSTARALAHALGRARPVRLALGGDFDFLPGTVITTVAEAKGLEMDTVIVPDRDAYGDDPESRRALYVAATRASHQLLMVRGGA